MTGHLVVSGLAMEFVGQYNEPFVEWSDVGVVELSSSRYVVAFASICLSQNTIIYDKILPNCDKF